MPGPATGRAHKQMLRASKPEKMKSSYSASASAKKPAPKKKPAKKK